MSKQNLNRTEKTKQLALSGVMLALATVLSFIKVFEWPFGGSITACSMLPIAILSYTYGVRWGLVSGLVHGVLQAVLGATMSQAFAGQGAVNVILILILDYFVAFSVVGAAGMLKNKLKNHTLAFALGTAVAVFMRYVVHVVSGYIFYRSYAEWFFGEVMVGDFSAMLMEKCNPELLGLIYSVIYNAAYMLPELLLTAVAAGLVISLIKPVRQEMLRNRTAQK
ncbi:MAG: energy-coupled thiamine transporter ThiT [Clostridia bacterium]|nr:energy-coupled thiamine transporter ThiT [Clostridia bacterium]